MSVRAGVHPARATAPVIVALPPPGVRIRVGQGSTGCLR